MSKLDILRAIPEPSNNDKINKKIKSPLLKLPFSMLVCGSVAAGKSNLLVNMILRDEFYFNHFSKIIIISPTVNNDRSYYALRKYIQNKTENDDDDEPQKFEVFADNLTGKRIDEIVEGILDIKMDESEKENWLIVYDDILGLLNKHGFSTALFSRFRHYNISLITMVQNFKAVSPVLRNNISGLILFRPKNQKEKTKILNECDNILVDFEDKWDGATIKPFNFLYINMQSDPVGFQNFTKKI